MTASPRAERWTQGDLVISFAEVDIPPTSRSPGLRASPSQGASRATELRLRMPRAEDGPRVSQLIASSPPLDVNSAYCNLLQCTDFSETCVLAERDGALLGWISAYRPPNAPELLFVWQVAVD